MTEPIMIQKCSCGWKTCSKWFVNITSSDGRVEYDEALLLSHSPVLRDVLAELVRLKTQRDDLGAREQDGMISRTALKKALARYGREKKEAWEAARKVLAVIAGTEPPTNVRVMPPRTTI